MKKVLSIIFISTIIFAPANAENPGDEVCNSYCTKFNGFDKGNILSGKCKSYHKKSVKLEDLDCCCENHPDKMPYEYEELAVEEADDNFHDTENKEIEQNEQAELLPEVI